MKLNRIRVRGLAPFIKESEVDFESAPGKLLAVIGGNGAGKSTLLNLYPAGLIASNKKFLFMPGRGSRTTLASLSVAKDSFLELGFGVGAQEYTVRHSINGLTGKTECSVTNGDGKALLKGKAGVTEFLEWSSDHTLPPEVFFGSVFSSQRTRGMLGMDPAERKSIILQVMGLDRYQKLASLASKHMNTAERALAIAAGKLQELSGDSVAACEEQVVRWQADQRTAGETLRLGTLALEGLRVTNETNQKAKAEMDATLARIKDIEARENGVVQRIAEMKRKLDEARVIVAEDGLINAAVESTKALQSQLTELAEVRQDIAKRNITAQAELDRLRRERAGTLLERTKLQVEVVKMAGYVEAEQAAKVAEKECVRLAAEIREAIVSLDLLTNELEVVRGEGTTTLSASRSFLRGELQYIADEKAKSPKDYAYSALVADAKAVKESEDHPAKLDQAKRRVIVADSKVKELERSRADFQRIADRLGEAQDGVARSDEAKSQIELTESALTALVGEQEIVAESISQLERKREANEKKAQQLTQEVEGLKPYADKAGLLAQAETRVTEYTDRLCDLNDEKEKLLADRCDLNDKLPAVAPLLIDLSPYETAIANAQRDSSESSTRLAMAEDSLARAKTTEARRIELHAEVATTSQDAADWKRLADDLGQKGVQALVVDAAGPELTVLANDLLHASGDSRFSLAVETTRMDSTGKRELEDCVISISDSRDGSVKTGASGGEESYINKALAFALTMMAVRHAGIAQPTIIDDEGDAALDVEYAPRYVSMLRRAADLMDASKVIFVTHRPDSWNLADARLEIAGGGITVS